jgi:hypothetical protein
VRFPAIALAYLLVYAAGASLLRDYPFARSIFGNIGLLAPAIAVCIIVLRRRSEWRGCQRLFWDAVGVGVALWVIGHLGWAFEEFALGHSGWLRWHTLFSLCGGISGIECLCSHVGEPLVVWTSGSLARIQLLARGSSGRDREEEEEEEEAARRRRTHATHVDLR